MIDQEKCKGCNFNPQQEFFPALIVCHHKDFHDKNKCPLEDNYDVGYAAGVDFGIQGVQIALVKLIEGIKDKPANEILVIVKEFAEAL